MKVRCHLIFTRTEHAILDRYFAHFPTARGDPSSPKKLRVATRVPVMPFRRITWVWYPPPLAIWGKISGIGVARVTSATGKVVNRKSPRELLSERMVSATKVEGALMSRTPVKSGGKAEMICPTNLAAWPLALRFRVAVPFPAGVCPSLSNAPRVS